jgi:hypothetical protein
MQVSIYCTIACAGVDAALRLSYSHEVQTHSAHNSHTPYSDALIEALLLHLECAQDAS